MTLDEAMYEATYQSEWQTIEWDTYRATNKIIWQKTYKLVTAITSDALNNSTVCNICDHLFRHK